MKCELSIMSDGDSTTIHGTIEITYNNIGEEPITFNHSIQMEGDGGSRGNYVTVDGNEQWWIGADDNKYGTQQLEQTIDDLYDQIWDQVNTQIDAEQPWRATVKDGVAVEIKPLSGK